MTNNKSHLDESQSKKRLPPTIEETGIFSSRKHSMDYFTADGVALRTGYKSKLDWYLLPIRECLDNACDFLWKYYRGSKNASIAVNITIGKRFINLKIRNSNEKNISIFSNLESIFDYSMRYGSKQNDHIIGRGMLGDAMKQILSLGYVLLHTDDDGTSFKDKQWERPLIIRHNKRELRIFLQVDKAVQSAKVEINQSTPELSHTDTELEFVLPLISEVRSTLDAKYFEQFCRKYSIFTTDISFEFNLSSLMNSNRHSEKTYSISYPALNQIAVSKDKSSVYSYKPEEFLAFFVNMHKKDCISVYDALQTFREGSHIKKNSQNRISIAELLSKEDKENQIEDLYYQLKSTGGPPHELAHPYAHSKERSEALHTRIAEIYDVDRKKQPSYKLVRGFHDDGIISFPYEVEILAVPFRNPTENETVLISSVNYSVSPKDNNFEADYRWCNRNENLKFAKNIHELLEKNGFHTFNGPKSRLPSVVILNLITPRREPHGYDKSSLDLGPYAEAISLAVSRAAGSVQTFRAAGYRFQDVDNYRTARRHDINTKVSARRLLEQFLVDERGLDA